VIRCVGDYDTHAGIGLATAPIGPKGNFYRDAPLSRYTAKYCLGVASRRDVQISGTKDGLCGFVRHDPVRRIQTGPGKA
jgi:hypothetical protein